jgi:hypothetical protein
VARAYRGVARVYGAVADAHVLDLVTRLTLIFLLLADWIVGADWRFKLPLRALAIVGLLAPPLHRSRTLWGFLALAIGLRTLLNWWTQDNHVFLLTYWCLAVYLALTTDEPAPTLATSAKLLIGLSFAFAALWKVALSKDFLDGTYFHYTFLTDSRFQDFGVIFGGMTSALGEENARALVQLTNPMGSVEAVRLQSTPMLVALARLSAWWTAAIETALAAAFLLPARLVVVRYRHAILLLFACTTYLVAPVATFGWVLMTIGVAQCEPALRRTRVLYVATAFLVLAYDYLPLLSFLRSLLGR